MSTATGPELSAPIRWADLGTDETIAELRKLGDWVTWWVRRYGISATQMPPCWYLHPRMLEELSALHTAHTLWFHSASPANEPLTWHREMEWSLLRLKTQTSDTGCTAQRPQPSRTESWPDTSTSQDAFAEFIETEAQTKEAQADALASQILGRS